MRLVINIGINENGPCPSFFEPWADIWLNEGISHLGESGLVE